MNDLTESQRKKLGRALRELSAEIDKDTDAGGVVSLRDIIPDVNLALDPDFRRNFPETLRQHQCPLAARYLERFYRANAKGPLIERLFQVMFLASEKTREDVPAARGFH